MRCLAPIALIVAASTAPPVPTQTTASLAGAYDGGQMEVAAGLELDADGRFRFMLSYGALDEEAAGRWRVENGRVLLTSDPVTPPRFVLLERRAAAVGSLSVALDVPDGMSRQYFKVEVRRVDGGETEQQFPEEDEPLAIAPGAAPVSVALTLPIFDLRSDPVPVGGRAGATLRFRFEPHDLGKVAFAQTPLLLDGDALVLTRHGLTLRFRRAARS